MQKAIFFSKLLIWKIHNISAWYIEQSIFYLVCWYATLTLHWVKGHELGSAKLFTFANVANKVMKQNSCNSEYFSLMWTGQDDHVTKQRPFVRRLNGRWNAVKIFFSVCLNGTEALSIPCLSLYAPARTLWNALLSIQMLCIGLCSSCMFLLREADIL